MFVAPACVARVLCKAAAIAVTILIVACAWLPFQAAAAEEFSGTADRSELLCLATAIYFEARGESVRGQMAVAEVILERARTEGRPKTICGVVYEGARRHSGCQFSFACDRKSDVAHERKAWDRAKKVATVALQTQGTIVVGATYFHVTSVRPRWALHMVRVGRVGTHIFYRPRRART